MYTNIMIYCRDERGRKYTEVVAMDASVFKHDFYAQFAMRHVTRELNKVNKNK